MLTEKETVAKADGHDDEKMKKWTEPMKFLTDPESIGDFDGILRIRRNPDGSSIDIPLDRGSKLIPTLVQEWRIFFKKKGSDGIFRRIFCWKPESDGIFRRKLFKSSTRAFFPHFRHLSFEPKRARERASVGLCYHPSQRRRRHLRSLPPPPSARHRSSSPSTAICVPFYPIISSKWC